jgi:hypothetical protein
MDWVIVRSIHEGDAAHFRRLANYDRYFDLKKGIALANVIPAEAEIRMHPDFPNDIELTDSLSSNGDLLFVNERVCQLFRQEGISNIELCPINVINHKGRKVKEPYFVVNVLSIVDCIDMKKSKYDINDIDKKSLSGVDELVLDEARLPRDIKLFRPMNFETIMLIERTVSERIQEQGLRGFQFLEVEEYTYP